MFKLFVFIIISVICVVRAHDLEFKYHSNEELSDVLKGFAENPAGSNLRRNLYNIGLSSGRPKSNIKPSPLWVLELTAAPEGKIGVPNIKLVGNVHGTETAGREVLLHFIQYLIDEYGTNEKITWLLNNTRIHIVPSLNPDGFAVAQPNNCYGCSTCLGMGVTDQDILISSNFPDYFHANEVLEHAAETQAVMKWMKDVKFVLSGSFFGSFVVAIYPYCNKNETFTVNPTPDDDVFQHLARTYAKNHVNMYKGESCPNSKKKFVDGIVNGASWQNHDADMTDYNYIFRGCMDVRFEISCCKYPQSEELENIWNDNKNALVEYCFQANRGVTGRILDAETNDPVESNLMVVGRNMEFQNFPQTGEFWRILLPGDYTLEVKANGYYTHRQNFTVKDYGQDFPILTNLTIYLENSTISTTTTTLSTTTETTTIQPSTSVATSARTSTNRTTATDIITQKSTMKRILTKKTTIMEKENVTSIEPLQIVKQNNSGYYLAQNEALFVTILLLPRLI
ncbi:unnamed protein product [Phyllotreta striolata]|uniref:Peptidase M14 domain-containing protein n=1 Tax=Phyllotreta striolata TaxID=444603 RepID=A0A9N9TPY4_PHYSR|nr:unnamed protein product [Phyllotreta striolata]